MGWNTPIDRPPLDELTDQALLDEFSDLVQRSHQHTLALLRHIDAIDTRKLWAKYGHPSMFDLCVSRYHMSESTAAKRIGAARAARQFPILFEMVGRGEIHLSGVHRLKAHLTSENHERVLAQAKHKSIRELEKLVAQLAPRADVPSTVRALPERREAACPERREAACPERREAVCPERREAVCPDPRVQTGLLPVVASPAPATPTTTTPVEPNVPTPLTRQAPRRAPDPEPLSPGRYKLQVTLDETAHQKLTQLQDLLAHQIPNSDPAAIIARALDALLTEVSKQKIAVTETPRARKLRAKERTRAVPAARRREVWTRDQGRCSFVGVDGHRCNETRGLEFAHVKPWAKGGDHSADNLGLRCRAHNAWEADRDYGAGFMATKRAKAWKVREPRARYAPGAAPPSATTKTAVPGPVRVAAVDQGGDDRHRRGLGGSHGSRWSCCRNQ